MEFAVLLLLAVPEQVFHSIPIALRDQLTALRAIMHMSVALRAEVASLREQMGVLGEHCLCRGPSMQTLTLGPVLSSAKATAANATNHRFVQRAQHTHGSASNSEKLNARSTKPFVPVL
jgi:hypothetical protein